MVVDRHPDRIAVGDLERATTYAQLAQLVDGLASHLDIGALRGPVIITVDEPLELAVGILAAAGAGRPCYLIDGRLLLDTRSRLLRRLGSATVFKGLAPAHRREPFHPLEEWDEPSGIAPGPMMAERVDSQDAVAIFNTSGSTGSPKLVVEHGALPFGRSLPDLTAARDPEHLATNLSPTSRTYSGCVRSLLSGDRFTGFHLNRHPPRRLIELLVALGPTHLACTPTVLRHLGAMAGQAGAVLGTVRTIGVAGEPLRWSDVALARSLCGNEVTVENVLGSTEAGRMTAHVVRPEEPIGVGLLPVGRAPAGRTVWISRDDGSPAPTGETGRIVVDGVMSTSGVPLEPLGGGTHRFRSADVGRMDASGLLWLEGRSDRTTKIAGMRVDAAAVEEALLRMPGVLDVAVVAVAVDGVPRLGAHVLLVPDARVERSELRAGLADVLPPVLMPTRFLLRSEPFALLASGKKDYKALQEEAEAAFRLTLPE